ncbi:MAG: RNA methyltransferase substrate-binding domain-containing protein, partial [Steroidobacteraceae bacterium]
MPRKDDPRAVRRGGAGQDRRGRANAERPPRDAAPAAASAQVTYGIHAVRELLQRSPQRVRQLWLSSSRDDAARLQELRALADSAGV